MRRLILLPLVLALLPLASGCVTRTVKKVLNKETEASLTVSGNQEVLVTMTQELSRMYKVDATLKTVETGAKVLRLVGAYAAVIDAMKWMLTQSLHLLANDEVSETLLAVAISAMKS